MPSVTSIAGAVAERFRGCAVVLLMTVMSCGEGVPRVPAVVVHRHALIVHSRARDQSGNRPIKMVDAEDTFVFWVPCFDVTQFPEPPFFEDITRISVSRRLCSGIHVCASMSSKHPSPGHSYGRGLTCSRCWYVFENRQGHYNKQACFQIACDPNKIISCLCLDVCLSVKVACLPALR